MTLSTLRNPVTAFLPHSLSALVGLSVLAFPLPTFAATLVADYQFNDSLASSIEGAPSLFDLGTDNFFGAEIIDDQSAPVFNFAEQTGLQLSTAGLIPNDSYSIAMLFNFDTVEFWRKIVDVNNRVTDAGLYTFSSDMFYYGKKDTVDGGTGAPLGVDEWVQVVFTRDSDNQIFTYVDGVEQLSFVDDNNYSKIVPDDVLYFFRDDFTTGDSENSSGAIARLRLYEGALSASEVAALDRLPETLTPPPSEPEATFVPPVDFPEDPNDPIASATPIDISGGSGTASGNVSTNSDIYSFDATSGQLITLTVNVTGTAPGLVHEDDDTTLYLYDEAGKIIGFNDDGALGLVEGGESALFNVLIPEDGTYYAAVTTYADYDGGSAVLEFGEDFNTLVGFAGTGLSNIDYNLNVSTTMLPETARFFNIALAVDPDNPVGSFVIDGGTILSLVLNGQQNTSVTGLIDVIVGENTLTFDNLEFILEFDEPFVSTDIQDVLNSLDSSIATAVVPPDEFVEDIIFFERSQSVPEPASLLGLLTVGALGASSKLKRKRVIT